MLMPIVKKGIVRIVFAGTPKISADILQRLLDADFNIVGILTQPDRNQGRGKKLIPSAVKLLADTYKLKIFQPVSLSKNIQVFNILDKLKPDVMIVVAYGLILPEEILSIPRYGCVNIHLSLLPKWRGAAPIQRVIEAGDEKTGVSIIQMDQNLDTGNILYQIKTNVYKYDTTTSLSERLKILSVNAIYKVLTDMHQGYLLAKQQLGIASYAKKIVKEEAYINWKLPSKIIMQKIRAFNPWPGTTIVVRNMQVKASVISILPTNLNYLKKKPGTIITVSRLGFDIQSATDTIRIAALQFPGKRMTPLSNLLNGYNLKQLAGTILE